MNLEEIRKHVDGIKNPIPHKKRSRRGRKYLGIPASWIVLIIGGLLVSGALISFLSEYYNVTIDGSIDISGGESETLLTYDGQDLTTTTTTITTMDIDTLNAGDTQTFDHSFSNLNGHHFQLVPDLSGMPLEYVVESDVWYGFTFKVYEDGTTDEIDKIILPSGSPEYQIDYYYDVHDDFLQPDPDIDFPFLLEWDIDEIFEIITSVVGSGSITKNPDEQYIKHDENIELTAVPDTGFGVDTPLWTGDVLAINENDNPLTLTMDSEKSVVAHFIELLRYIGFYGKPTCDSCNALFIKDTGGITVQNYAEDTTYFTWTHNSASSWTEIEYDVDLLNWGNGRGIEINDVNGENGVASYYWSDDSYDVSDGLSIVVSAESDNDILEFGIVFDCVDVDNYKLFRLDRTGGTTGTLYLDEIVSGVSSNIWSDSSISLATSVDAVLKVMVHPDGTIHLFCNGVSEYTSP